MTEASPMPSDTLPGGPRLALSTFLITDIEGSTRLWETHAAAMGVALAIHDRLLRAAVERTTDLTPGFSTDNNTSDARFIKDQCPIAELNLPNGTMHKTDECATLADIEALTHIYHAVLTLYFASPP